jgi:peptidoglycan/xylan/chitin deacetylase (PgdA/CDA1 family)
VPVYWSIVPGDWDPISPRTIRERVLSQVHPGAVVVLHAGRPWHHAADAVEDLVRDLREREYEIVPLSRMLESGGFRISAR